jgi:hypothetical protein
MQYDDDPTVFASARSTDQRYSVVFEDDGTVAYGYILLDEHIVGDVWLYNHGDSPRERHWDIGVRRPPFANPAEFLTTERFIPVSKSDEVSFVWLYEQSGIPTAVEIWIRNVRHARLSPGSKPGCCRLATNDGPLARRLIDEWNDPRAPRSDSKPR